MASVAKAVDSHAGGGGRFQHRGVESVEGEGETPPAARRGAGLRRGARPRSAHHAVPVAARARAAIGLGVDDAEASCGRPLLNIAR